MASNADNNIVTIDNPGAYVSKHAGVGFYNQALLVDWVDTQYSAEFGKKFGGAQTGQSIEIKFPAIFQETEQVEMDDTTINALIEETKKLTLDTDVGIHADISITQVTLEIEAGGSDYAERVLQPMGKQLNAGIERRGFKKMAEQAQNTTVVENYTGSSDDAIAMRKDIVRMRAKLEEQLCPQGDRCTILPSTLEVDIANEQLFFFHNKAEIDLAYKQGKMNMFGGLKWGCSNLVHTRTNGAGGAAGLVIAAGGYTSGSTTMTITGIGAAGAVVGDKLEFPGIELVNSQSKEGYGTTRPIQRAIKAINGDVVTIDKIWGPEGNAQQNASALPTDGQAITVLGTAGERYVCIPVFQKLGVTLANADMYLPNNVDMAKRNKVMGVAQNFVRAYDIIKRRLLSRYEALITWDLPRPEWVGVIEVKVS